MAATTVDLGSADREISLDDNPTAEERAAATEGGRDRCCRAVRSPRLGLARALWSRGSFRTDGVWIADYGRGPVPRRRITTSVLNEEDRCE